jgi:hypothetical protein
MKKFFVILFLAPLSLLAQDEVPSDFAMWYSARASTDLKKDFDLGVRFDVRMRDNATSVYRYFGNLSLGYSPLKYWKATLHYRYSDWAITTTHRIDLDNTFQYEIEKESFDARLRLQREFGLGQQLQDRLRIRLRYQHVWSKRFRVFGSAEYFYTKQYNFNNWNQQRYTVGTRFRVALGHFITLFVRYEDRFNVESPRRRYIGGITYEFKYK